MKLIIFVALALVAIAVAAPPIPVAAPHLEPKEVLIKIVRSEYEHHPEGGYAFGYETENGIHQQEQGDVKEVLDEDKKPHQVVVVRGSYGYTKPDGSPELVSYYADETGFHAEGDSIPKEPVVSR